MAKTKELELIDLYIAAFLTLHGVPPRLMTPAMSIHNILEKFRRYTMIEKVIFMGAVASCFPPQGSTGVEVVANEMEGELATAGIKDTGESRPGVSHEKGQGARSREL